MFIKRDRAIEAILEVIDSGILYDELEAALVETVEILQHEENDELSLWGADDAVDLFIGVREDLMTPEWEQHCQELYDKYKIKTS